MNALRLVRCSLLVAFSLVPIQALADEGLYLNWDQCGPSGSTQRVFACDTNVGEERLYCAFTLAQTLDQVLGVEIVVDVAHAAATLPPWWQYQVSGCRFGLLSATADPPDGSGCADFWLGQATGGLQGYAVGQPHGGANQARMKFAFALLSANTRTLDAGTLYNAARIVFSNSKTTGTGSCSGCELDACLVLNSITIKRLPGAPGGDVILSAPAPGGGNMATWQGDGGNCAAVPTRHDSWGRLKSLYR